MGSQLDPALEKVLIDFWSQVFTASNNIVKQSNDYGFALVEVIPNPNIHQILKSLKVISNFLNLILDDLQDSYSPDDVNLYRMVINAQQQILRIERAAFSLKNGDETAFNAAISELKNQAQF